MKTKPIPKLGIGGPVGSGKTRLIEKLVPILLERGYRCCIISNDVISKEDAERMRRTLSTETNLMPEELIIGLATGGCPHTAIREDPSMNLAVVNEIQEKDSSLDLIIIESGGDNIMTTFSPALADYFIYIIDVSGGDKYPRKGGLGIESCDLLVINKIDLAPYVGANLAVMQSDAERIRPNKPYQFVNCSTGQGVDLIADRIINDLLFEKKKKKSD
ncbi:MAG: urease accessory protein UreG [Thaumarchaeota archaeon]|nr:urease accessory protein UreG [Nitrososphaerota archaeon]